MKTTEQLQSPRKASKISFRSHQHQTIRILWSIMMERTCSLRRHKRRMLTLLKRLRVQLTLVSAQIIIAEEDVATATILLIAQPSTANHPSQTTINRSLPKINSRGSRPGVSTSVMSGQKEIPNNSRGAHHRSLSLQVRISSSSTNKTGSLKTHVKAELLCANAFKTISTTLTSENSALRGLK